MNEYASPYLEPHQSRSRPPTAWELELAGALEGAFAKGFHEIDDLIRALNETRVRPRSGGDWTAEGFYELMHELGA